VPARPIPSASPSFIHSDRRLARFAQPLRRFVAVEAAGGAVLVAAAAAALVWANVWPASYTSVWSTDVRIEVGNYEYSGDLVHLVNDLLMGLFFFVVGMEIKRELVHGELRDRRTVALPAIAALGGMLVPALIFLSINAGGSGQDGWAIPMATDIAFALGVVALLGSRVPASIKVLLLTLAIADDIGAIVVIAVFYPSDLDARTLAYAAGIAVLVAVLYRLDVAYPVIYLGLGLVLWLLVYESGVHATMAGVVMGLLTPALPRQTTLEADEVVDVLANRDDLHAADVRQVAWAIRGSVSACDRLIDLLHPWTSFVIVPLFALANAGVELRGDALADPSAVFVGVFLGLVLGKPIGIAAFAWVAVRLGLGRLPDGARWSQVVGVGILAGIGFTVSLFITELAFDSADLQDDAKLGTLSASIVAALLGSLILSAISRRTRSGGTRSVGVEDGVHLVDAVERIDDTHRA
jgi:Na+:H+ antiporter, NhaA family